MIKLMLMIPLYLLCVFIIYSVFEQLLKRAGKKNQVIYDIAMVVAFLWPIWGWIAVFCTFLYLGYHAWQVVKELDKPVIEEVETK